MLVGKLVDGNVFGNVKYRLKKIIIKQYVVCKLIYFKLIKQYESQ